MRKLYIFIALFLISVGSFSQTWTWAKKFPALQNGDAQFIETSGPNLVITGGTGSSDIFIMLTDSTGDEIWTNLYYSQPSSILEVNALAINNSDIYVSGTLKGNVQLGNTNFSTADFNGFIIKLNLNGQVSWAKTFGGTGYGEIKDLYFSNNELYFLGLFNNGSQFGSDTLTSASPVGIVVAKLDGFGNINWLTTKDIYAGNYETRLRRQSNGSFIISGTYEGYFQADSISISSGSPHSPYLLSLDQNGIAEWAKNIKGFPFNSGPMEIGGNNEIIFSTTYSYTDGETGYISKYANNNSSPLWEESLFGYGHRSSAMFTDIEVFGNEIYYTGHKHSNYNYAVPDDDTTGITVVAINSSGLILWSDTSVRSHSLVNANAITKGSGKSLYITGKFNGDVSFGSHLISGPNDSTSVFLAKLQMPLLPVGTQESIAQNFLSVYPNPANQILNISIQNPGGNINLELINNVGQTVFTKLIPSSHSDLITIPLNDLIPPGIYILKAGMNSNMFSSRIVVLR